MINWPCSVGKNFQRSCAHPHAITSPPFVPAAGRLQPGHFCVGSLVSGWSLSNCVCLSRCRSRTVRPLLRDLLLDASAMEGKKKGRL